MDEFSHSGYVAWFGIIEIIAKENGNELTGQVEIKPQYLKRKLRISTRKLQQIFEFCSGKVEEKSEKSSTKPKLLFRKNKEKWFFELPKMLELKDNYTKDLQGAGKKPSKHKEEEEEEEEEEDNTGNGFPSEKPKTKPSLENEIFNLWVKTMQKKGNTKLTDKRKKAIKGRIKEGYQFEDFEKAITNCKNSIYHQGKNDTGTIYDDIELICRSGEKLENFRDNVGQIKPQPKQGGYQQPQSLSERYGFTNNNAPPSQPYDLELTPTEF